MSHYREIDISRLELREPASQPAPQLMWVELATLVIDERYQRPLARRNIEAIKRIADDFRWARFSPLLIAPIEGGRYAVIDGQHRAHAAALCGFKKVPAMVSLVAPEEQALAFIEINTNQIKVRNNTVYRAALAAGESWALQCHTAVAAAGCEIMTRNNVPKDEKQAGQVFAVQLIRQLIERNQSRAVIDGLRAMIEYDDSASENFQDVLLRAWLFAVAETGASREVLLHALQAKRPALVIETADRFAEQTRKPRAVARRQAFVLMIRKIQEAENG